MNLELGSFFEKPDPSRDVSVFQSALLIDGKFAGSINFAVDSASIYHGGLSHLPALELGDRLVNILRPHVAELLRTRWLPRSDGYTLELRIVDDAGRAALGGTNQNFDLIGSVNPGVFRPTSISVEGLFGFETPQEFSLHRRCTVAFGENGSGKTSIRKIFSALRRSARGESLFDSTERWLFQALEPIDRASVTLSATDWTDRSVCYSIDVKPTQSGLPSITKEHLQVERGTPPFDRVIWRPEPPYGTSFLQQVSDESGTIFAGVAGPSEEFRTTLSLLSDESCYPIAGSLQRMLDGIRIYSSWDLANTSRVAQKQPAAAEKALVDDGSNLGSVLSHLQDDGGKPEFDDWFERVMDGRPVLRVDNGTLRYEHEGRLLTAAELSDGSLRWAQTIAACLSPATLLIFDEPELGLHPDLISSLAELLSTTSLRVPILVFTHSRDLLDRFDELLSTSDDLGVIAFEQSSNGNVLTVPDLNDLRGDNDLGGLSLGDLWVKGLLGGNRW